MCLRLGSGRRVGHGQCVGALRHRLGRSHRIRARACFEPIKDGGFRRDCYRSAGGHLNRLIYGTDVERCSEDCLISSRDGDRLGRSHESC